MIRSQNRLRLCTALLLCNLAFIWGNSLFPGTMSGALSDYVKDILDSLFSGTESSQSSSGLLRKLAHFTEFATLGLLLCWFLEMLQKSPLAAFALAAAAACIDETIQIFVPDRGPGIRDVCIDCCGAATGILLLHFGHTYWKKKQAKHILEET